MTVKIKKKRYRKSKAILAFVLVAFLIAIFSPETFEDDDVKDEKPAKQVEQKVEKPKEEVKKEAKEETPKEESPLYKPKEEPKAVVNTTRRSYSTWDERSYPNFYKELGTAVIDRNVGPGDVIYDGLDSLGRTQGVYGNLTHENFEYGKRPRKSISHYNPSGWTNNRQVEVVFLDGSKYHGWFYNRSHLLAHSLGGEDALKNLVTGTRAQNVGKNNRSGGMQYCEEIARDFLRSNPSKSLYYFATPVYNGNELVPRSVIVDMLSSDGSINKEVEVFNVAPNFTINYATGEYYQG